MKKTFYYLIIAAVALGGCAKTPSTGLNDAEKRYFDAWIQVHHPEAQKTALGAYVISETPGAGVLLGDCTDTSYIRVNYVVSGLDGTISSTNIEQLNKQLGTYSEKKYYGPVIWTRSKEGLYAGIDEALSTMRVGGTKTTVIPGWLLSYDWYDNAEGYLANVSGTNTVYKIEVLDKIKDINKWETDSIARYLAKNYPSTAAKDSLKYGFYYIQKKAPTSTTDFPNDTTFYINYTGRLLNGLVFDTTEKDTAKLYGLYSSSTTYAPKLINWYGSGEDYTSITMTSSASSIIKGFAYALSKMHPYEKCRAIFYSGMGYGYSGSGSSIPAYAPLIFDIEITDK